MKERHYHNANVLLCQWMCISHVMLLAFCLLSHVRNYCVVSSQEGIWNHLYFQKLWGRTRGIILFTSYGEEKNHARSWVKDIFKVIKLISTDGLEFLAFFSPQNWFPFDHLITWIKRDRHVLSYLFLSRREICCNIAVMPTVCFNTVL